MILKRMLEAYFPTIILQYLLIALEDLYIKVMLFFALVFFQR